MPDTYVDVGPMAISKDSTKVAAKYAAQAKKRMRDTAAKAIRSTPGFTPDKTGNPTGFHFTATLTEITFGTLQGMPSVTCKVNGFIATFPRMELLVPSVTGSATLAPNNSDRDVEDCIQEATEDTMKKRVIPYLKTKTQSKP